MKHETHDASAQPDSEVTGSWKSRFSLGPFVLGVLVAYLLWGEHRAHVLQVLPYLLLLACPLLHFFMHRRHHGRGGAGVDAQQGAPQRCHRNGRRAAKRNWQVVMSPLTAVVTGRPPPAFSVCARRRDAGDRSSKPQSVQRQALDGHRPCGSGCAVGVGRHDLRVVSYLSGSRVARAVVDVLGDPGRRRQVSPTRLDAACAQLALE